MCQAWGNPSSSHPTGRDQDGLGSVVMGARGSCQVWSCRQEGEGAHRQRTGEPGQDAGRPPRGHRLHLRGHGGGSRGDPLPGNPCPPPPLQQAAIRRVGMNGTVLLLSLHFPSLSSLQANNMVIHTACRHFHESQCWRGDSRGTPHIVTSSVEHDSIRLPLEQLGREGLAEATFVPVSPRSGQAEVDDVLAAIRPNTCLVSLMLANNETGVIMPVAELSQRVCALNQRRAAEGLPRVLVHTDAAQMIGKGRVDVQELGVDYLTIVGHKFHGPRIGALYARGPGTATPLHPMLFGGGQERSFRPGTENTPMIAGLGQALPGAAELRDSPGGGAERAAAERGAQHGTGRRGQSCARSRAGCGAAGAGPGPIDPGTAPRTPLSGQSSCCQLHLLLKETVVGVAVTVPALEGTLCGPGGLWSLASPTLKDTSVTWIRSVASWAG
uniref:Selenocysteine lyase n=1 Tax=Corvus moneduloides TaxID=1196302 RepID=A0A8U7NY23_CORMO